PLPLPARPGTSPHHGRRGCAYLGRVGAIAGRVQPRLPPGDQRRGPALPRRRRRGAGRRHLGPGDVLAGARGPAPFPLLTMASGTLYVVGTPLGNLEDMSPRAVRVLGEVAVVAAEDTRTAQKLWARFGLSPHTVSYFEGNEAARAAELVERLRAGD